MIQPNFILEPTVGDLDNWLSRRRGKHVHIKAIDDQYQKRQQQDSLPGIFHHNDGRLLLFVR